MLCQLVTVSSGANSTVYTGHGCKAASCLRWTFCLDKEEVKKILKPEEQKSLQL